MWPSSRADLGSATGKHQMLSPWLLTSDGSPSLVLLSLICISALASSSSLATDPQAAIISPIVRETLVTPLVSSPLFSLLSLLLLLPKRSFSTPRLLCLPLACLLRGT